MFTFKSCHRPICGLLSSRRMPLSKICSPAPVPINLENRPVVRRFRCCSWLDCLWEGRKSKKKLTCVPFTAITFRNFKSRNSPRKPDENFVAEMKLHTVQFNLVPVPVYCTQNIYRKHNLTWEDIRWCKKKHIITRKCTVVKVANERSRWSLSCG